MKILKIFKINYFSAHLGCSNGRCVNPCDNPRICPTDKQCQVFNHLPTCVCVEGCNPSVSICLKDRGCPAHQACVNYQESGLCINVSFLYNIVLS